MNSKRLAGLGFSLLILFLVVMPVKADSDIQIEAKAALLMEVETGQILYKEQPDLELPTASLTKIMTLLVAMEKIREQDIDLAEEQVVVSRFAQSRGGSQIWLSTGEKINLKDLLKAVLLPSANDATIALAEYIAGTEQNFVRMMNQKADQLGLEDSWFANPTGLPAEEEHYSTPEDIAVMARRLITNYPIFLEWGAKRVEHIEIKGSSQPIYNTNQLAGHYPGLDGLKTGWTDEAQYCLVGTAQRGDQRFLSVVMGAATENARQEETRKLLNYGFRAFQKVRLINSGLEVKQVRVANGREQEVGVETAAGFSAYVKHGRKDKVEQEINLDSDLKAPLEQGTKVGSLHFIQDGKELGKVDLITKREVKKVGLLTKFFRWLAELISGLVNN